jgi:hypothetical protein
MKARLSCALAAFAAAGAAQAQFETDFEALNASPDGVVLTDQDGYYVPVAGSVDFLAYTYQDNALGIPQNLEGGEIFVAGEGQTSPAFARAQRDMTWPTGTVRVTFDLLAAYTDPTGADPTNNVGSFSIQPYPGSASAILLASWTDTVARTWQMGYLGYTDAGVTMAGAGTLPGAEWAGLSLMTWYRFETVVDFDANQITSSTITNLGTGDTATADVLGTFLEGGAAGGAPHPTGFRFFGGGGTAGNVTAWDNLVIEQIESGVCYADCDESGELDFFDFLCFQDAFAAGDPYADCDESGELDFFDFLCFQNAFAAGCP